MDLVQLDKRHELFEIMMSKLQETSAVYGFPDLVGFPTSIWDESLYKAWSKIVCSLIPNMNVYQSNLKKLKQVMDAREIILFEKATFLVVCSSNTSMGEALDPKRFEKISNVMKNFKQSSMKLKSSFKTLVLNDTIYVSEISPNMMCFIVLTKSDDPKDLVLENIKKAKQYFQ